MKILTFDVEDWFHILDYGPLKTPRSWDRFNSRIDYGLNIILEELENHQLKATFFVLGWVAEKRPDLVRKLHDSGHHIASHSYAHQLVYELERHKFREDVKKSKQIIEDVISGEIDAFRAPGFSITQKTLWAFEELIELGFSVDCSVFPAGRAHGGMPTFKENGPSIMHLKNGELKIFPINTKTFLGRRFIYSGGGYFRLFPKHMLSYWFREDEYVMTYFHPRDFDDEQPMIPGLTLSRRFKCYVGLKSSRDKLRTILSKNSFITVMDAVQSYEWNEAPRINYA